MDRNPCTRAGIDKVVAMGDGKCLKLGDVVVGSVTTAGGTSTALLLGAGATGSGSVASTTAGVTFVDFRTACSATSGNSYGSRWHHKITGAGGSGASVRAYGYAYGVAAANCYGLEATAEFHTTEGSAITGLMAGIKADIIANLDATGTCTVLDLSYNVASGKTVLGVPSSFIRFSNSGSGTGANTLFSIAVAKGTNSATSLSTSNHDTQAADTYIKIDINGTAHWLLATTHAPAGS